MLGAGDAFMSGFLRGWLRDEPLETCCAYANANGRFRGLASPVLGRIPDLGRAQPFPQARLASSRAPPRRDAQSHPLGDDAAAGAAVDHGAGDRPSRADSKRSPTTPGAPRERISAFKLLAVEAAAKVAAGRPGYGMLLDGKYGREALFRAVDHDFWIGRPVEEPGSRPLDFEFGGSLGAKLQEWPIAHTIKCLCFYHPDDPPELKARQERELLRLADAARTLRRELLIEIIASKNGPVDD